MRSVKNVSLSVLLILSLGVISCSSSLFRNYGQILPAGGSADPENGVVNHEFRYYISGSDLYPNALIGLQRDYSLDPEALWKEVVMTPEKLRTIVGYMKSKASEYGQFQHPFELLDTKGKKIGFWYSILSARTFIRFAEDGTVTLPTPDLETYEKLESKGGKDI